MSKKERVQIRNLDNGNAILLDALMGMVNQSFHTGKDGIMTHSFMSCDEYAISVLIDAGMAIEVKHGYKLFWDKINKRLKTND